MQKKVIAAIEAKPDNLHFPGLLSQLALHDVYRAADAFCFCSQEETEGIVVLGGTCLRHPGNT